MPLCSVSVRPAPSFLTHRATSHGVPAPLESAFNSSFPTTTSPTLTQSPYSCSARGVSSAATCGGQLLAPQVARCHPTAPSLRVGPCGRLVSCLCGAGQRQHRWHGPARPSSPVCALIHFIPLAGQKIGIAEALKWTCSLGDILRGPLKCAGAFPLVLVGTAASFVCCASRGVPISVPH